MMHSKLDDAVDLNPPRSLSANSVVVHTSWFALVMFLNLLFLGIVLAPSSNGSVDAQCGGLLSTNCLRGVWSVEESSSKEEEASSSTLFLESMSCPPIAVFDYVEIVRVCCAVFVLCVVL